MRVWGMKTRSRAGREVRRERREGRRERRQRKGREKEWKHPVRGRIERGEAARWVPQEHQ
jgi:hypothetical protein